MKEEKLIESLKNINSLFEKNGINIWLDTGTLLGAVRNKQFIPWDYDVDIGAWYEDIPKIINLKNEIQNQGFDLAFFEFKDYIKILNPDCEIDINLYHKKTNNATRSWYINKKTLGKTIDYLIWLFVMEKPDYKKSTAPKTLTNTLLKVINKIPEHGRKKIQNQLEKIFLKIGCIKIDISIPSHYFENLSDLDFYNSKFKAPSPMENYLEYRYGANWKIPDKNYVYYKDDGSIIKKT
jgi:lipopolysaccharide cholinephosphotransferase